MIGAIDGLFDSHLLSIARSTEYETMRLTLNPQLLSFVKTQLARDIDDDDAAQGR